MADKVEQIRKEIKRLSEMADEHKHLNEYWIGCSQALNAILSFIDSLQCSEQEQSDNSVNFLKIGQWYKCIKSIGCINVGDEIKYTEHPCYCTDKNGSVLVLEPDKEHFITIRKMWKPSDEQMNALKNIMGTGVVYSNLASLYNDLKKLREE